MTHGYPDGGPRLARRWRSQAGRALDPETLGLLASIGIERGELLDGSKTYKVHLLPNLSAKDFWSFTPYDNQTRSMLQAAQRFPRVNSMDKGIVANPDGSVDVR